MNADSSAVEAFVADERRKRRAAAQRQAALQERSLAESGSFAVDAARLRDPTRRPRWERGETASAAPDYGALLDALGQGALAALAGDRRDEFSRNNARDLEAREGEPRDRGGQGRRDARWAVALADGLAGRRNRAAAARRRRDAPRLGRRRRRGLRGRGRGRDLGLGARAAAGRAAEAPRRRRCSSAELAPGTEATLFIDRPSTLRSGSGSPTLGSSRDDPSSGSPDEALASPGVAAPLDASSSFAAVAEDRARARGAPGRRRWRRASRDFLVDRARRAVSWQDQSTSRGLVAESLASATARGRASRGSSDDAAAGLGAGDAFVVVGADADAWLLAGGHWVQRRGQRVGRAVARAGGVALVLGVAETHFLLDGGAVLLRHLEGDAWDWAPAPDALPAAPRRWREPEPGAQRAALERQAAALDASHAATLETSHAATLGRGAPRPGGRGPAPRRGGGARGRRGRRATREADAASAAAAAGGGAAAADDGGGTVVSFTVDDDDDEVVARVTDDDATVASPQRLSELRSLAEDHFDDLESHFDDLGSVASREHRPVRDDWAIFDRSAAVARRAAARPRAAAIPEAPLAVAVTPSVSSEDVDEDDDAGASPRRPPTTGPSRRPRPRRRRKRQRGRARARARARTGARTGAVAEPSPRAPPPVDRAPLEALPAAAQDELAAHVSLAPPAVAVAARRRRRRRPRPRPPRRLRRGAGRRARRRRRRRGRRRRRSAAVARALGALHAEQSAWLADDDDASWEPSPATTRRRPRIVARDVRVGAADEPSVAVVRHGDGAVGGRRQRRFLRHAGRRAAAAAALLERATRAKAAAAARALAIRADRAAARAFLADAGAPAGRDASTVLTGASPDDASLLFEGSVAAEAPAPSEPPAAAPFPAGSAYSSFATADAADEASALSYLGRAAADARDREDSAYDRGVGGGAPYAALDAANPVFSGGQAAAAARGLDPRVPANLFDNSGFSYVDESTKSPPSREADTLSFGTLRTTPSQAKLLKPRLSAYSAADSTLGRALEDAGVFLRYVAHGARGRDARRRRRAQLRALPPAGARRRGASSAGGVASRRRRSRAGSASSRTASTRASSAATSASPSRASATAGCSRTARRSSRGATGRRWRWAAATAPRRSARGGAARDLAEPSVDRSEGGSSILTRSALDELSYSYSHDGSRADLAGSFAMTSFMTGAATHLSEYTSDSGDHGRDVESARSFLMRQGRDAALELGGVAPRRRGDAASLASTEARALHVRVVFFPAYGLRVGEKKRVVAARSTRCRRSEDASFEDEARTLVTAPYDPFGSVELGALETASGASFGASVDLAGSLASGSALAFLRHVAARRGRLARGGARAASDFGRGAGAYAPLDETASFAVRDALGAAADAVAVERRVGAAARSEGAEGAAEASRSRRRSLARDDDDVAWRPLDARSGDSTRAVAVVPAADAADAAKLKPGDVAEFVRLQLRRYNGLRCTVAGSLEGRFAAGSVADRSLAPIAEDEAAPRLAEGRCSARRRSSPTPQRVLGSHALEARSAFRFLRRLAEARRGDDIWAGALRLEGLDDASFATPEAMTPEPSITPEPSASLERRARAGAAAVARLGAQASLERREEANAKMFGTHYWRLEITHPVYGRDPGDVFVVLGDRGKRWLCDDRLFVKKADEDYFWRWCEPTRRKGYAPPEPSTDEDDLYVRPKSVNTDTTEEEAPLFDGGSLSSEVTAVKATLSVEESLEASTPSTSVMETSASHSGPPTHISDYSSKAESAASAPPRAVYLGRQARRAPRARSSRSRATAPSSPRRSPRRRTSAATAPTKAWKTTRPTRRARELPPAPGKRAALLFQLKRMAMDAQGSQANKLAIARQRELASGFGGDVARSEAKVLKELKTRSAREVAALDARGSAECNHTTVIREEAEAFTRLGFKDRKRDDYDYVAAAVVRGPAVDHGGFRAKLAVPVQQWDLRYRGGKVTTLGADDGVDEDPSVPLTDPSFETNVDWESTVEWSTEPSAARSDRAFAAEQLRVDADRAFAATQLRIGRRGEYGVTGLAEKDRLAVLAKRFGEKSRLTRPLRDALREQERSVARTSLDAFSAVRAAEPSSPRRSRRSTATTATTSRRSSGRPCGARRRSRRSSRTRRRRDESTPKSFDDVGDDALGYHERYMAGGRVWAAGAREGYEAWGGRVSQIVGRGTVVTSKEDDAPPSGPVGDMTVADLKTYARVKRVDLSGCDTRMAMVRACAPELFGGEPLDAEPEPVAAEPSRSSDASTPSRESTLRALRQAEVRRVVAKQLRDLARNALATMEELWSAEAAAMARAVADRERDIERSRPAARAAPAVVAEEEEKSVASLPSWYERLLPPGRTSFADDDDSLRMITPKHSALGAALRTATLRYLGGDASAEAELRALDAALDARGAGDAAHRAVAAWNSTTGAVAAALFDGRGEPRAGLAEAEGLAIILPINAFPRVAQNRAAAPLDELLPRRPFSPNAAGTPSSWLDSHRVAGAAAGDILPLSSQLIASLGERRAPYEKAPANEPQTGARKFAAAATPGRSSSEASFDEPSVDASPSVEFRPSVVTLEVSAPSALDGEPSVPNRFAPPPGARRGRAPASRSPRPRAYDLRVRGKSGAGASWAELALPATLLDAEPAAREPRLSPEPFDLEPPLDFGGRSRAVGVLARAVGVLLEPSASLLEPSASLLEPSAFEPSLVEPSEDKAGASPECWSGRLDAPPFPEPSLERSTLEEPSEHRISPFPEPSLERSTLEEPSEHRISPFPEPSLEKSTLEEPSEQRISPFPEPSLEPSALDEPSERSIGPPLEHPAEEALSPEPSLDRTAPGEPRGSLPERTRPAAAAAAAAAGRAVVDRREWIIVTSQRYGLRPWDVRMIVGHHGNMWLLNDGRYVPKRHEGECYERCDAPRNHRENDFDDAAPPQPELATASGVARQRSKLAAILEDDEGLRDKGGLLAAVTSPERRPSGGVFDENPRHDIQLAFARRSLLRESAAVDRAKMKRRLRRRKFRAPSGPPSSSRGSGASRTTGSSRGEARGPKSGRSNGSRAEPGPYEVSVRDRLEVKLGAVAGDVAAKRVLQAKADRRDERLRTLAARRRRDRREADRGVRGQRRGLLAPILTADPDTPLDDDVAHHATG
ncbi:hypothetical protein JL720_15562 [Aureococcus anophagefferens]|nr:hypothetical protein JL720_15562 [Aureococcus anophagefferens]